MDLPTNSCIILNVNQVISLFPSAGNVELTIGSLCAIPSKDCLTTAR